MTGRPDKPISVLVVDDSAVNRRELTRVLDDAPGIKVSTAPPMAKRGSRRPSRSSPTSSRWTSRCPSSTGTPSCGC